MKFIYFVFGIEPDTKYMGKRTIEFGQVIKTYCGLDVNRDAVLEMVLGKGLQTEPRTFGTTISSLSSLKELGEWLESLQVADAAMESTGIYWNPVLHALRQYPLNLFCCQCKAYKKSAWDWQKN